MASASEPGEVAFFTTENTEMDTENNARLFFASRKRGLCETSVFSVLSVVDGTGDPPPRFPCRPGTAAAARPPRAPPLGRPRPPKSLPASSRGHPNSTLGNTSLTCFSNMNINYLDTYFFQTYNCFRALVFRTCDGWGPSLSGCSICPWGTPLFCCSYPHCDECERF